MAGRRGNVHVVITGDSSGLDKATRQAEQSMGRSDKAFGKLKKAMALGAAGAAGGVVAMVNTAADFETQMSALGSVTNANAKQMAAFRKQALDAGATTKYSASEAAAAQIELAKGGLSIANVMRGGLRAGLALAAAGNLELADAAAFTANAMNQFGLQGSRSMMVADALATAANATTADVADFGVALTQGGGAAKGAGMSFHETVVALEALAQSGIKNSDAGTSLKSAMLALVGPTRQQAELTEELGLRFFDAEGSMRPLADVSAMLRDRLGEMGNEQRLATLKTIAGADGFRALLALYDQGPRKLQRLERGLRQQGSAARVAARQQDNLKGRIEALGGSIETLSIIAGSVLIPPLTAAATATADFLGGLASGQGAGGQFASTMKTVATDVAGVAVEVGQVGWTVVQVGARIVDALAPAAMAAGQVGLAIGRAFAPVLLTFGKVSLEAAQFGYAVLQTRPALVALTALIGALTGRMVALGVAWGVARIAGFVSAIRTVIQTMGVLRAVYVAQTGITNASTVAILRHAAASRLAAGATRSLAAATASTGFGALLVIVGSVAGALLGMKANTDRARFSADELNASLRRQVDAMRAIRDIDLDVAQRRANLRSATVGVEQAQQRVNQLVRDGKKGTTEYRAALVDLEQAKLQQRRAQRDLNRAEEDAANTRRESTATIRREREEIRRNVGALREQVSESERLLANNRRLAEIARRGSPVPGRGPQPNPDKADEYDRRADQAAERLARTKLRLERALKQVNDQNVRLKRVQLEAARASGASRDRVQALKDELTRLRDRSDSSAGRIRRLRREISDLKSKRVRVDVDLNLVMPGAGAAAGDLRGDGWGLARAVRRGVQAKARQDPAAFMSALGGLGSGPVGAIDQFTPVASRFGLAMSSGYRPGSITSSGNVSLHALNRARDYAGSAASMMAFARFMAASFGSRLKELIYSPLGFSIKNGQRVAPYAVRDHYDHVHVAMRRGGLVPAMLSPGEVGVEPSGNVFQVPGRPVAADTVPMHLRPGTAILTGHGQNLMARGASLGEAVRRQRPHFQRGGVVKTYYSVFDDAPPGAFGSLTNGYAELGTANKSGSGTGVGNFSMLVGRSGELAENFPLSITINGKTKTLRKRDRGFGQGGGDGRGGGGSDSRYTLDIWKDNWGFFGLNSQSKGPASVRFKGAGSASFMQTIPARTTYPLLGNMLAPLVDDALMGGIEAGMTGASRLPLLTQVLEGIVPEAEDRATRERVSLRGPAAARIAAMIKRGDEIAGKNLPYQYGGYGNPSWDCSGYVSSILNAGGLLRGRLDTVGLKSWGKGGRGKNVTVGIRGGAGRTGHTMMQIGRNFYESSGAGVGKRSGWSGTFDTWRRPAWRRGGLVGPNGQRTLPPSSEGMAHLRRLSARRRVPVETLLNPSSPQFVGWGMRHGGLVRYFRTGGDVGRLVGTRAILGPRGNPRNLPRGRGALDIYELIRLIGGRPGTVEADRLTRELARRMTGGPDIGSLMRAQRMARNQIRSMHRDGWTGEERIQDRRLRGAIALLQDQMGRPIGRELGRSDRAQTRIQRQDSRRDDLMVMRDLDPESIEGNRFQQRVAGGQLRTLNRRRRGLARAMRRARRTGDRAAIDRVREEINEVDDQRLGLRADRKTLRRQARELRPTAKDFAQRDLALSELTPGSRDNLAALRKLEDIARRELDVARRARDPRAIADAATELKAATDALAAATPTPQDYADMNLALAELTAGAADDLQALTHIRNLAEDQLNVAKASGDPREIADAARNLRQAADALRSATPTDRDFADMNMALAELTATNADDLRELTHLRNLAQDQLNAALASGDPKEIADAARNLKQAADSLRAATPTERDFADRDLAIARLTETLDDDLAAQLRLQAIAQREYADALATEDPRDDIETANNLASVNDAVRSLTEEMTRSNELTQQRLELDRTLAEQNRQFIALAENQGPTILAALAELMNDGIGGLAKRGSRTPGVPGIYAKYK